MLVCSKQNQQTDQPSCSQEKLEWVGDKTNKICNDLHEHTPLHGAMDMAVRRSSGLRYQD